MQLIKRGLLRRFHGVVVWEYDTIFNTRYFIINSEITVLSNRTRSAVLHIRTQVAVSGRVMLPDTHTHAYP